MKRTPLVRRTGLTSKQPLARTGFRPREKPLARGADLARTSSKRRKEDRVRAAMKAKLVANRGGVCEVIGWPLADDPLHLWPQMNPSHAIDPGRAWPCSRVAVDVHEPLTRARGGSIVDPDNAVLVCREHHDLIHANPAEAKRRGYLKESSA